MNIARAVRADDFIVQHHLHPDCDDKKSLIQFAAGEIVLIRQISVRFYFMNN